MLQYFIVSIYGETTYQALSFIGMLYPLWLPIILSLVFWKVWVRYVRYHYFTAMKTSLIEIKIPREIAKSPLAMEIVLAALAQYRGESTIIKRYWNGSVRPWFSLEIISIGGDIRFLMWCDTKDRNNIEAQIYAQYPEVEVRDVEDYTKNVKLDLEKMNLYASNFQLANDDPYPIKTYVDFGLDKNPKEEHRIDPLTSILELLGSIKKGEQVWLQYVITVHKSEKRGGFLSKKSDWKDDAKKIIKEIQDSAMIESPTPGGFPRYRFLSQAEQEKIAAIERNISKYAYDIGIRAIYTAPKDIYNVGMDGMLKGLFQAYNTQSLNRIEFIMETDFPKYPWDDFMSIRQNRQKYKHLDAYKRRMFFYDPYYSETSVISTEALASLYHFPSSVAATPGLVRIPSKKADAPSNLPT